MPADEPPRPVSLSSANDVLRQLYEPALRQQLDQQRDMIFRLMGPHRQVTRREWMVAWVKRQPDRLRSKLAHWIDPDYGNRWDE